MTAELVRQALACISPAIDRETWVRLAMAIKHELGADGFEMWDHWSQGADNYSATASRDTWRSIKPDGKVTGGTLFGIAKDHGFRFPSPDQAEGAAAARPEPAAAAAAQAERERKRAADEASYRARADEAARVAGRMWAEAAVDGASPYLKRKGVGKHGVCFAPDGSVLVPLRNAAGDLLNLQRIAPEKPADGKPEKRFLPGGRKSGLWHWCGDPAGAGVLLLAEGYATAASIHEATGRPVAVAFDAGNLANVAAVLREAFPAAALLVCGDDDRETLQRTGKNPGRDKAAAAVRKARSMGGAAAAVFPAGLPEAGTDFNDLAAHAGADAVRAIVEPACMALASEVPRQAAKSGSGAHDGEAVGDDSHQAGNGAPGADVGPPASDPFTASDDGVWHTARDAEGNAKKPQWLCSRLDVPARTRADDTNGWGYLLEFSDPDNNAKTWAMPSAMLSGDGAEWAGRLRDMGLRMAPGPAPRNLIARYIDTRNPVDRVRCTDRVGWHGPVYVLPGGSIGTAEGQRYVFQSESGMEDTFRRHGSLAEWQQNVAALCVGNSRLIFTVCCAFAGPMLRPAGIEGGGVHMRGNSGLGKTTGLKIAASVWGRPSYMQRWRTTDNALEATAVQHCDGLLILDEIGQLDGRVLGECAYMLANGQEKGRATRGGLSRRKRTWVTLFLSSGEVSMADHMAEAGKRTRAGMEVRMLDVPLDAGRGMGGIEELHGHENAAQMSESIAAAAARCYGTAGRAWLEWACAHHGTLPEQLLELVERYRDDMVPEAAAEQVRRAGNRFALIAAAGELATRAGITNWQPGQAAWGVRECFNAWLASRGHVDNGEVVAILRQVRKFIELHGEGRFTWWHRAVDDHGPKTLNRAGFRRLTDSDGKPIKNGSDHQREFGERMTAIDGEGAQVEYFVLREVFEREICSGFDSQDVARLLRDRGHLVHEKGRLMVKARLPGMGNTWCYQLRPSLSEDEL